jgi:hypothetical protein
MKAFTNLRKNYSYKSSAQREFAELIKKIDELIFNKFDNNIEGPAFIDDDRMIASWPYLSTVIDDEDDEIDDDCQDDLFEEIFIGISITDDNNTVVSLKLFIGLYGKDDVNIDLDHYAMNKLNYSQLTQDVITTALTISKLDHFLSGIKIEQRRIMKKLIFNL